MFKFVFPAVSIADLGVDATMVSRYCLLLLRMERRKLGGWETTRLFRLAVEETKCP